MAIKINDQSEPQVPDDSPGDAIVANQPRLVRQSEIVIWSSAGEAGSLVEPAGAGLMTSSPDVPA
jgi:hypothetical protein